jgi:hypothetical protein
MTQQTISERDYRRLNDLIRAEWGLAFSPAKRVMLETRLGRRARARAACASPPARRPCSASGPQL